MGSRFRRGLFAVSLLIAAAGCSDSPTLLEVTPESASSAAAERATGPQGQAHGLTPFRCVFQIRTKTGVLRSRVAEVNFPKPELHLYGASRPYIYQAYSGTELILSAECAIPATAAAARRMDRAFKVDRQAQGLGEISTMGCVTTEEGCLLDPIEVTACPNGGTYPDCDTGNDKDYDQCYDFGACGDSGDWDWGSPGGGGPGGNTGEPGDPSDPCNTGDAILDDPEVYGGFDDLWKESTVDGAEAGGWIVQEPGNQFRLVPFQNPQKVPCGLNISESPPPGTVSMVHTHPWPMFTVNSCGFLSTGTPSEDDVKTLQQLGLSHGFLLDPDGIGKYTATNGESSERLSRCGY